MGALPRVAVLLATHNGRAYVEAQLRSLAEQADVALRLHWADDASSDGTPEQVSTAIAAYGMDARRYTVHGGSATRAFLGLAALVPEADADFFAFCDQDDVWFPEKLSRATQQLGAPDSAEPRLYCARTQYVDANLVPLGVSPLWRRPAGLGSALAQNIAAGNTLVMNAAAFRLLKQVAALESPAHDWTAYLAVSAAGGHCVFDPQPCLAYRQHGANVVGDGAGFAKRWQRILNGFRGGYARWNRLNLAMLTHLGDAVPPAQRAIITAFATACHGGRPWQRLRGLHRSGVYRMTRFSHALFVLAALLGRL